MRLPVGAATLISCNLPVPEKSQDKISRPVQANSNTSQVGAQLTVIAIAKEKAHRERATVVKRMQSTLFLQKDVKKDVKNQRMALQGLLDRTSLYR